MPSLQLAAPLLALGLVTRLADARVPAFVRQTGLVCNQCHVSGTNSADLTFTAMKFRLNGYRSPQLSETVGAGSEGAIGRQLARALARMLSVRARTTVAQGTKAASDPMLPEPTASPVTMDLNATIDLYVAGPIGEHVGMWSDFCAYGGEDLAFPPSTGTTCAGDSGYLGLSNLAAQITTQVNGNTFGVGANLVEAGYTHSFMGMTPAAAPNHQLYTPGTEGGGSAYTLYGVYAFLADRFGVKVSLEPGEESQDLERFNFRVEGGIFPLNSDAGWLLLGWMLKGGNDMTPAVGGVPGIAAGLSKGGAGYPAGSTARALRMMYSVGYGFSGRGPHSFVGTLNLSVENDEMTDGASDRLRAVGSNLRYNFQGKYGVDLYVYKYGKWDFTDASGVTHPIPLDPGFALRLVYSPAQQFAFYVEGARIQSARLDQNWRAGNYWNVNMQFLW